MFNLKSNVIFINPSFYTENGDSTNAFVVEKSDFTAKSNGAELIAETISTVADPKKGKKTAVFKVITPKDKFDSDSNIEYSHINKYIEKYKNINTTLNLLGENDESDGRKYIFISIPFNGAISELTVEGSDAEIVSAQYTSTPAIKFNADDRLLYGKICYLLIKVTPNAQGFTDTVIKFTSVSSKKNDSGSCNQTERNINVTIPVAFISESTEDAKFAVPLVYGSNVNTIPLTEDGKIPAPSKKFNELFNIKTDKTIKNRSNGEHHKRSSYFTKKNDDIVTNFFNNDAYNEKPMSKKFKEAKRRYSEYDDE